MGAWNYGVFDDDTAYDALTDLKNSYEKLSEYCMKYWMGK